MQHEKRYANGHRVTVYLGVRVICVWGYVHYTGGEGLGEGGLK